MEAEVEDFLEHFGVKGMRWGQRKSRESGGGRSGGGSGGSSGGSSGGAPAAGANPHPYRKTKIAVGLFLGYRITTGILLNMGRTKYTAIGAGASRAGIGMAPKALGTGLKMLTQ